jgi:hypothetical protein
VLLNRFGSFMAIREWVAIETNRLPSVRKPMESSKDCVAGSAAGGDLSQELLTLAFRSSDKQEPGDAQFNAPGSTHSMEATRE